MKLQTHPSIDEHIGVFNLRNLRRVDFVFLFIVTVIAAIGILTLYSANRSTSVATPYYTKQLAFFLVGLVIAITLSCIDYRALVSFGPVFYVTVLALLVAVLLWGREVNGAQRWIYIGPIGLQPSEQSKLALVFMLAWYFNLIGPRIRKLHYFLLTFFIAALPAALILKQPNLGTTAVLGPIVFAMLFVAGCKRWHLAALVLVGLATLPVLWSQMKDYQKTRILAFLRPESDPQGSGYHTIQSMITVGSGGLTGKGYQEGTQTYLSYLPEHHTDFIFSLMAEEWGFMGSAFVVMLFGLLLLRGLSYAQRSPDMTGALLAVGIVAILAFHVFVNIAITVGLMPVTGIPLPFLSYGGSFYLTTMLCVGVLLSVRCRRSIA